MPDPMYRGLKVCPLCWSQQFSIEVAMPDPMYRGLKEACEGERRGTQTSVAMPDPMYRGLKAKKATLKVHLEYCCNARPDV
jgi:hypothetical protein